MAEAQFEQAVELVKRLKTRPNDDELLELYGLYKQASVGDCNIDKPGLLDFKAKSKWEAWQGHKGISQEDARKQYVTKVQQLEAKYGS